MGGTFEEIARGEADVNAGRHPDRPYCLVTQPCVVDSHRAPEGRHTLWAYCHVPNGSDVDMTERMESQIERFAPGFRDLILGRATSTAVNEEQRNPSYVGGDINAGAATLRQMVFRPTARWNPYRTDLPGSTCARRRRRRVVASTACAGSVPPAPPCGTSGGAEPGARGLMLARALSFAGYRFRTTRARSAPITSP